MLKHKSKRIKNKNIMAIGGGDTKVVNIGVNRGPSRYAAQARAPEQMI